MKKKIFILLAVFSLTAVAGGMYLAYSFDRRLSDFNNIILLHHVENLREHLLLNIHKVEIDLFSQKTDHPESRVAIEDDLIELGKSITGCYACHHTPEVVERLDDLREQIDQYKGEIGNLYSIHFRNTQPLHYINPHILGDSLIGKVETMVVSTSEKLREQTEDSLRKANRMKAIMISIIAAGPAVMIIFAITVLGGVTGPIQRLLAAARTLKTGDLEHRIGGLRDEFGELAVGFNDMAASLQATMQAIEESEKRYRLLFESAGDSIFIFEAEGGGKGKILQANLAAARMHGYTEQELEQMDIRDLAMPEDAAFLSSRIERILAGEWLKFEANHRKKDGSIFPVEVSTGLLETAGHRFILGINRDLTDRKQAEKELRRTERIRVAGELATGLAHEIKNPLAGIMVSMEALSQESSLADEDRDVLNRVIMEIKRIEFLLKGLLNYARPPKPQFASTSVNAVINAVADAVLKERLRTLEHAHPIYLVRDLDSDLPEIMADPMQLKQIFMNLMLNAVDAMPDGGTLTVKTSLDPDFLRVELSDTGRGIDSDALAKIFSPFFTTKAKGTGLGLSITKRLVEDHGGNISIENNGQGGATCVITLPARQREGAVTA